MKITILTPDKEIFQGAIVSVKVPGSLGQFQVLKGHAPIVSSLGNGEVTLVTDAGEYKFYNQESGNIQVDSQQGKEIKYRISGGFVEVLNDNISLLVRGIQA